MIESKPEAGQLRVGMKRQPGTALRGVWLVMIAVASFFLALSYAYLHRHGLQRRAAGYAWLSPALLLLLSGNTLLLLASSLALRRARQWLEADGIDRVLGWMAAAMVLGLGFLGGQAGAWLMLQREGVQVAGLPQSGYFFLLTGFHAAHLAAGLMLLGWVLVAAWSGRLRRERPVAMQAAEIVWHSFDATWLYLYLMLVLYR